MTARINSRYADPSGIFPDLQIFFLGYSANCAKSGEVNAPLDPKNPDLPRDLTISPVVLHPKSRGYLTLKSNNPLDPPLIYANYLTDPEDVATLVEGVRVVQRLTNTSVLRTKYGIELDPEDYGHCNQNYEYDSDEFWECAVKYYTGPENHQAGSCKMGPSSDRMAVVNPKLQLHGISTIRVADASIMPSVVSGNTHATVVMIAEKAANFIKETWMPSGLVGRGGFGQTNRVGTFGNNQSKRPVKSNHAQEGYHHGYPNLQHSYDFHRSHPNYPNPYDNGYYSHNGYYNGQDNYQRTR